jgi:hypothetical protein
MVPLTIEARNHVRGLSVHYVRLDRTEALRYLILAISAAQIKIAKAPDAGLPAPRPYKQLARTGQRWIKQHVYWVRYNLEPLSITGVFYETLDIPSLIR